MLLKPIFQSIYLLILCVQIRMIYSLYSQTPDITIQTNHPYNSPPDLVLSPDGDKIALTYYNNTQNAYYIQIYKTDRSFLCQTQKLKHIHSLLQYSQQYGPITSAVQWTDATTFVPYVYLWSAGCTILYKWQKKDARSIATITKRQTMAYIAFFSGDVIMEYQLYGKKQYVRNYSLATQNQYFLEQLMYSSNYTYIFAKLRNNITNTNSTIVFSCTTGQKFLQIDQNIVITKSINNGKSIVYLNYSDGRNFWRYDFQTNLSRFIVSKARILPDWGVQVCTKQNYIVMKYYELPTYKFLVYKSDPQTHDEMVQTFLVPNQQVSSFVCDNTKLAFAGNEGRIKIYNYKEEDNKKQESQFPYLIVAGGGAGFIIIVVVTVICIKKFRKSKRQTTEGTESLIIHAQGGLDKVNLQKKDDVIISDKKKKIKSDTFLAKQKSAKNKLNKHKKQQQHSYETRNIQNVIESSKIGMYSKIQSSDIRQPAKLHLIQQQQINDNNYLGHPYKRFPPSYNINTSQYISNNSSLNSKPDNQRQQQSQSSYKYRQSFDRNNFRKSYNESNDSRKSITKFREYPSSDITYNNVVKQRVKIYDQTQQFADEQSSDVQVNKKHNMKKNQKNKKAVDIIDSKFYQTDGAEQQIRREIIKQANEDKEHNHYKKNKPNSKIVDNEDIKSNTGSFVQKRYKK